MRLLGLTICALTLWGCGYVSKDKFDEAWDADGDGWGLDEDCDDLNPLIYPFAPDVRGDGCDADCGEEIDADGDDWPASADCDDQNPEIFPCNPDEVDSDVIDSDCDGHTTVRQEPCNDVGWTDYLGLDPDFAPALTAQSDTEQVIIGPEACGVE